MSVNMNLKKIVIVVCILCLAAYWFISTNDRRVKDAEYETLVRVAERQAVEIAIIEQASKLANYKQQIEQARTVPILADSKDVGD